MTLNELKEIVDKKIEEGKGNYRVADSSTRCDLEYFEEGNIVEYNNKYYGRTETYMTDEVLECYRDSNYDYKVKVKGKYIRFY